MKDGRDAMDAGRSIGRVLHAAAAGLALAGGVVLAGVALMTVTSVLLRGGIGAPIPGDFELAAHGTAVAVFAFLPYCHLLGGNVTVTVFTDRLPARARTWLDALASLLLAVAATVLAWRLAVGMGELRGWGEVTMVLGLPIWWGLAAAIPSLTLLAVVGLYVAWRHLADHRPAGAAQP